MKSRIKWFFEENKSFAPGAGHYALNRKLTESSRYNGVSLGLGERYNFTK